MWLIAQVADLGNCGRLNYNGGRRSTKPVIVMVMMVVRLIIEGFQTTPFNHLFGTLWWIKPQSWREASPSRGRRAKPVLQGGAVARRSAPFFCNFSVSQGGGLPPCPDEAA